MRRSVGLCALALASLVLTSCSGDQSLNPPQMDLLACQISIDRDDYRFGDPIQVKFERNTSYQSPPGFLNTPCQSIGLGTGKIQILERGKVVHEFKLGMVRVGGVPFVHRVKINKYHLTSKRGSFELRAVCHGWQSNTVGFELG